MSTAISAEAGTQVGLIEVRLTAIRYAARDTNLYELTALAGGRLPGYQPGAHIDLHLPNGLIRQYSLIEAEPVPTSYSIGVKRDPASRGGRRGSRRPRTRSRGPPPPVGGGSRPRPPASRGVRAPSRRDRPQPHRTLPPLTLRISPVTWRARSERRNGTGPATSSAVSTGPAGMRDAKFDKSSSRLGK